MANRKINELTSRVPSLTDLMLVGDPSSGYSYKCTVNDIALAVETGVAGNYVTLATTQTISGAKTFSNVLTLTSVANSPTDTDKFLVLNASNVVNYRTGSEVLSDIGGADDSLVVHKAGTESITGTKNFNAIQNFNSGINIPSGSSILWGDNTTLISGAYTVPEIVFVTGSSLRATINNSGLTLNTLSNATTDTDRFLISDSGVIKYRTGAELLSDIGGASASNISGTANYIPKFTSSSAIGNSVIYETSGLIGIGTTSPSAKLTVNGNAILNGSINATEVYLASPNGLVLLLDSSNANGGYTDFQTNSTTIGRIGTATQVIGSGGTSVFAISSRGANDFVLGSNGTERMRIASGGAVSISSIANATTDTDKFLVSDSGVIKYRTGAELLSDIGGIASSSISGTTNYLPKFTGTSTIGNSIVQDNSTYIDIGGYALFTRAGKQTIINPNVGAGNVIADFGVGSGMGLTFTTDVERMRLTSTGNLGLGVTPSAWAGGSKSFQLDKIGLWSFNGNNTYLGNNYFLNSSVQRIYIANGFATEYAQINGEHIWYTAASGTAGNAISFTQAMTLFSTGNLAVGGTVDGGSRLGVNGVTLGNNNGGNVFAINSSGVHYGFILNNSANTFSLGYGPSLGTVGTSVLTWNSSGNVGIGTTSPARLLHINGGASATYFQMSNNASGNGVSDGFQIAQDGANVDLINRENGYLTINTNNIERLRIDASGNLGLGVTPSAWQSDVKAIQISNSGANISASNIIYSGGNNIWINNNSFQNSSIQDIYTRTATAGQYWINGNTHIWQIAPSGTAGNAISFTQAMTLDASGRLGIGTTSPRSLLDIVGASSDAVINLDGGSSNASFINLRIGGANKAYIGLGGLTGGSNNDLINYVSGAGSNIFYTNATERMRITSGGNVGIGTTSPALKLTVFDGAAGDTRQIRFGYNDSYYWELGRNDTKGGLDFTVKENNTPSTKMFISSSGNVGIGTTSPSSILHVIGNEIRFSNSANASYYGTITHDAASTGANIYNSVDNGGHIFQTSDTERMRITSGGNVGIGTTSPTEKLEVNGNIKTAAPSGGTAQPWKLGNVVATAIVIDDQYINVEINGVTYNIPTCHPN